MGGFFAPLAEDPADQELLRWLLDHSNCCQF
jgi:hypothetical protein